MSNIYKNAGIDSILTMIEMHERAKVYKVFVETRKNILNPSLSEKRQDELIIMYLQKIADTEDDTMFSKHVCSHGSVLLAKFSKNEIDVDTVVREFRKVLQVARQLETIPEN